MNVKEYEIKNQALRQLEEYLGNRRNVSAADGDIVSILGRQFICEVRENADKASFNHAVASLLEKMAHSGYPGLLISSAIPQELMMGAKADGIYTLDASGNCEISPDGGPYLSIRGRKTDFKVKPAAMAFRTAGLKVLYYLLVAPENIRGSLRDIQARTGVSIGTVKHVIDALYPTYCFDSKAGRNLKNMHRLLDFWTEGYNQLLKPRLLLSTLNFAGGQERDWKDIILPEGMFWGGECGAFLLDGYLLPSSYELYTEIPSSALLKTGKVLPAQRGDIVVYEKFWRTPQQGVHPVVLYADLMGTGDGRCREQAQRLLSHELQYIL